MRQSGVEVHHRHRAVHMCGGLPDAFVTFTGCGFHKLFVCLLFYLFSFLGFFWTVLGCFGLIPSLCTFRASLREEGVYRVNIVPISVQHRSNIGPISEDNTLIL